MSLSNPDAATLRLLRFRLAADSGVLVLAPAVRALLCIEGSAQVEGEPPLVLSANLAKLATGELRVSAD